MARTLVTGATGFIGQHLVEALLASGDEVKCLVRSTSQKEPLDRLGAQLVNGDVAVKETLPGAVADVETIYHLAGLTKANSLAAYCRVNADGVRNILDACVRRTTPPRIILVSSLAAAGPMTDCERLRTETDELQPVSRYGKSKRAGELAARSLADKLPITIVRPPIVLGPRDWTGLSLFRSIRRCRSFVVVGSDRRLSAIHVTDLARALIAAAKRGERLPAPGRNESCIGCGYYFVAADEHPLFRELARMIGRSINRPYALALPIPVAMLWLIGGIGEMIGHLTGHARYLNLDRACDVSAGHWICSPAKANRDLGFVPGAPLTERIEQTAQWYQEHGYL